IELLKKLLKDLPISVGRTKKIPTVNKRAITTEIAICLLENFTSSPVASLTDWLRALKPNARFSTNAIIPLIKKKPNTFFLLIREISLKIFVDIVWSGRLTAIAQKRLLLIITPSNTACPPTWIFFVVQLLAFSGIQITCLWRGCSHFFRFGCMFHQFYFHE